MQKFKVNSQSVPKIEWKQTDGQTKTIALPAVLMRSVIIIHVECYLFILDENAGYSFQFRYIHNQMMHAG